MRFNSVRAETLASVTVGAAIIAIVSFGISQMLEYHSEIQDEYSSNQTAGFLKTNSINVIRRMDASAVSENETFALYKDPEKREFSIMTGSSVDAYRYVDRYGNWISNTGSHLGDTYSLRFSYEYVEPFGSSLKYYSVQLEGPLVR